MLEIVNNDQTRQAQEWAISTAMGLITRSSLKGILEAMIADLKIEAKDLVPNFFKAKLKNVVGYFLKPYNLSGRMPIDGMLNPDTSSPRPRPYVSPDSVKPVSSPEHQPVPPVQPQPNTRPPVVQPQPNTRPPVVQPQSNATPPVVQPQSNATPAVFQPVSNKRPLLGAVIQLDPNKKPRTI